MKGKTALITGGAKGIGAATAMLFAENGIDKIYLVDLDDEMGKQTESKIRTCCN